MHNPHDPSTKQMFCQHLAPTGDSKTEFEVSTDTQRIDLWFEPDPLKKGFLPQGLLGRMASQPCAFEFFHDTPRTKQLVECVRKHLNFCHQRSLGQPKGCAPIQWVVSSGRPDTAIKSLRCRPSKRWPSGVYFGPKALHIAIVVISELTDTPDTLIFRLNGVGKVLKNALSQLLVLPETDELRKIALPILARLHKTILTNPKYRTKEQEFLMATQDLFELHNQEMIKQGMQQGIQQGMQQGMQQGIQQGIQQGVHDTLAAIYEARFGPMVQGLRAALDAKKDPEQLNSLCKVFAQASQIEVDRALRNGRKRSRRRS